MNCVRLGAGFTGVQFTYVIFQEGDCGRRGDVVDVVRNVRQVGEQIDQSLYSEL